MAKPTPDCCRKGGLACAEAGGGFRALPAAERTRIGRLGAAAGASKGGRLGGKIGGKITGPVVCRYWYECDWCRKRGQSPSMFRYHFDRCRWAKDEFREESDEQDYVEG
jgi:hypothetical protein